MLPSTPLRAWGIPALLLVVALPGAHPVSSAPLPFPTGDDRDLSPNRFLPPLEHVFSERGSDVESRADRLTPGSDLELGGWNESCVVVNPLDPTNIAYASLWELRVSTDGGATFQPAVPQTVPNTHLVAGDPCVAFDSQGRLFWTSIGVFGNVLSNTGYDIFISECDPATGAVLPGFPVNVTAQAGVPASAGNLNDKEWLAADAWPGSPFQDRLYLVWSQLNPTTSRVTYSSDHGQTWSPVMTLGPTGTAFKWPVHVAVAPNGDVFAADHRQPNFNGSGPPDGTSGRILLFRSTDGGASFVQQTNPAGAGDADFSFNYQLWSSGKVPGSSTLLVGSAQPWILPDPLVAGRISVVYCDDPDNDPNTGDAADVYLVRSTDSGATWQPRVRVDSGPGTTFQILPNAAIEPTTGAIAVTWLDNRSGAVNANGHYFLGLHGAVSLDGGVSFGQDFPVSDLPFDPDAGAHCRYSCAGPATGVWNSGPNEAWACGFDGLMHWDGSAWTTASNGGSQPALGVWGSDANHVWTVGGGGEIRFFDGSVWTGQTSGTTETLVEIYGRAEDDVFASGTGGTMLHWDGNAWSSQATGTTETLFDIHALASGTAWVAGFNGTLLHHDGVSWSPEAVGLTTANLMAVYASSDTDVWISGQTSTIWHGDGSTWTPMNSGTATIIGAWGSSSTDVWFGGVYGVVHWNGSSFDYQDFSGQGVNEVFGSSATEVFAAGNGSTTGRLDGTEWVRLPNPLEATNPTLRIGEYNGIDANVVGVVTWVGNKLDASLQPVSQQSLFDTFDLDHQVGATALQPLASLLLMEPGRPNPFRWVTTVSYALPEEAPVRLSVHDAAGRLVSDLDHGIRAAGRHDVTWDGRDREGRTVAAGVYFVRLDAAREAKVSKVVLVR